MAAINPHIAALIDFKINDMRPFSISPADLAQVSLEQAHALAIMLGSAFAQTEETSNTNGSIIHSAFDGIAALIALAAFAQSGGES